MTAPDRYDEAYRRGYEDGVKHRPMRVPADDTDVNYRDGYEDGNFKREQDVRS